MFPIPPRSPVATASTYGTAGSVVLNLLWIYYSSLIMFYGAAFTKIHLLARGQKIIPRSTAVLVDRRLLHLFGFEL